MGEDRVAVMAAGAAGLFCGQDSRKTGGSDTMYREGTNRLGSERLPVPAPHIPQPPTHCTDYQSNTSSHHHSAAGRSPYSLPQRRLPLLR